MALIGGLLVPAAILTYFIRVFVFLRFSYKTWIFDAVVVLGMAIAALAWIQQGGSGLTWGAMLLGLVWFAVSRLELTVRGSKQLKLRVGDPVPAMSLWKTNGASFTEQDLIAGAPALLTFYRGWWCPTSKAQLTEFHQYYDSLRQRGLSIYAASVDEPEAADPIQQSVGDQITILCSTSEALLEEIGIRDRRGAAWYDRLFYGAPERPIAMPATLVIDKGGRISFVARSTRLDERPPAEAVLASLASRA